MKTAFLSESLPPSKTGQAMVLSRLLGAQRAEDYCLISAQAPGAGGERLPGAFFHLPPHFRLERGYRYGLAGAREAVNVPVGVIWRARQVAAVLRRERCDAVVACTGDILDLPAGYLASRLAGARFYAYVFDHYSHRECSSRVKNFWARRFEPRVLRGAAGVIVPNELLAEDLRRSYGVAPVVIHNSLDISEYEGPTNGAGPPGGAKIVYTGDVYEAHYDAFRNVVAAIGEVGREDVKLHLYTPRTSAELAQVGIRGPVVCHPYQSPADVPRLQRQADLLFLPLAFDSPYPELVRTSATTKLGEYLAARRPVLVHAPADSFVAWYFREHACGLVVDRSDPAALAQAIRRALDDGELRRRLSERAWLRACEDFSIARARQKFGQLLGVRAEGGV